MPTKLILAARAADEIVEAKNWYALQSAQAATAFTTEILANLDYIQLHPRAYPILHDDIRRCSLRRFPYTLYYEQQADTVIVLACIHQKQSPEWWP